MLTILATLLVLAQAPADDARQIHWQRTLADAESVAALEHAPLFVAINADGESASDRIVRERYRDPAWVARTRSFVCVVASVFRHTPRDYDDEGRRIPCPRLGEITCGEHMALEPLLNARFLAGERIVLDGEVVARISPRHALILPDGTKSWDLFLLFDLRDLDTRLESAVETWHALAPRAFGEPPKDLRHRARAAFEDRLATMAPSQALFELRDRMRAAIEHGTPLDHGVASELRLLLPKLRATDVDARAALFDLAAATGTCDELAAALRERLCAPSFDGEGNAGGALLLPTLAALAGRSKFQRSFVLSYTVLGSSLETKLASQGVAEAWSVERSEAPALDVLSACANASNVVAKRDERKQEPLPEADELERALESADTELARERSNPAAQLALGRAALMLARRRMQDGGAGIDLLLEDARLALAAADEALDDPRITLDRARVANYQSRFEEQERLPLACLDGLDPFRPWPIGSQFDDVDVEALRWIGDAAARLLPERAGGPLSVEASGIYHGGAAFTCAALSSEANATDWLSLASFFGALGRGRERVALAFEGLRRFPAAAELRAELASACWSIARPDLLALKSEQLAGELPKWAECAWYAGYARVLLAESQRRALDADGALASYAAAERHFRTALELEANFRDSSEHYLGMCALGRGFVLLGVDRRAEAAACAVEAARVRPAAFAQRDGLEREGVDLIDTVLEWRASGASTVEPLAWLAELERADPRNAFYARSICDAELREGLRAFGRDAATQGHANIEAAIGAGRRALALEVSDDNKHALAQACTVLAEKLLESSAPDLQRIASALVEAAGLLGLKPPAVDGELRAHLVECASALRARLGAARPVFRPGR